MANCFPFVSHQGRRAFYASGDADIGLFYSGWRAVVSAHRPSVLLVTGHDGPPHGGPVRAAAAPRMQGSAVWPKDGQGSAVRRAHIRARASRRAHMMCTRLHVITRIRAAAGGCTMTGYICTLYRQVTVNLVTKNTTTASGAMAGAISAGTGRRYG